MFSVYIDFETKSCVDLKACGMYVYATDETTDVNCLSVRIKGKTDRMIWLPPRFRRTSVIHTLTNKGIRVLTDEQLQAGIDKAERIHAHNVAFERLIWNNIMTKRYGFKPLKPEVLRCTAAKAAMHALPRGLDGVANAMQASVQKDLVGKAIMLKMCKPLKPKKDDDPNVVHWFEPDEAIVSLCEYCCTDTEAEEAVDRLLMDLSPSENRVFQLDQDINDRGVPIDVEGINNLIAKIKDKETALILEIQKLTNGFVQNATQIDNLSRWLTKKGYSLDNLQKFTLVELLKKDLPDDVRRVVEIRQSLGKTSTAKLKTFLDWCCEDGRVKGMLLYHGAGTGRWSGKGPQTQNLPRDSYAPEVVENIVSLDSKLVEAFYECPILAASKCIRGMIKAPNGYQFMTADFSAIEARVVAWLAGEEKILEAFRAKKDLYKIAASDIYGKDYDKINKEERAIGKVAVLALGYQGWVGAFNAMATGYGVYVSEEQAIEIVSNWRRGNENIVKFWHYMENAALNTIKTKKTYKALGIMFGMRNDFLHMKLPSGRMLSYYQPRVENITKNGRVKEAISFMGEDGTTKKWVKQYTYGGKLTENAVQAVARDLLVEAMQRVEAKGFKTVMHIHDEIVAEIPDSQANDKTLKEFEGLLSVPPSWAKTLPLAAEGWYGKRYKK